MGERMGVGAGLRRALFMRSLRKVQEEPPEWAAPPINRRMRRMLRMMVRTSDRAWPLPILSAKYLISQSVLYQLGTSLGVAGLAEVTWISGRRCMRLTELGIQEIPGILATYRSQRLIMILLRSGPRSAAYVWAVRRRDRAWRKAAARERESPDADAHETDLLW